MSYTMQIIGIVIIGICFILGLICGLSTLVWLLSDECRNLLKEDYDD